MEDADRPALESDGRAPVRLAHPAGLAERRHDRMRFAVTVLGITLAVFLIVFQCIWDAAVCAVFSLVGRLTHQNIAELWNAMTRPSDRNGLGLSVVGTEREVRAIDAGMSLLPDSEAVYREWRRIVVKHSVSGVQSSRRAPGCGDVRSSDQPHTYVERGRL